MGVASAVLTFGFDATFHLGDLAVRWQTLGIAFAVLAGIAWCALIAGRTPAEEARPGPAPIVVERDAFLIGIGVARRDGTPATDDPAANDPAATAGPGHLRRDDLLFIILGVLPGAVIMGRIGYGLLHADWYQRDWRLLLDPAGGSMELTGAVIGGTLTGIYVAALLDAPVGRWLHVSIRPLLLVLALGKAAEVLGGGGQGAIVAGGSAFATAYAGPGPWGSPGAELPAVPSQLLDAAMAVGVLALVGALGWGSRLRRPDGRLFAIGLAAWALGHAVVAATWRDVAVLGALNAEQLICLAVASLAGGSAVVATLANRRRRDIPIAAPG